MAAVNGSTELIHDVITAEIVFRDPPLSSGEQQKKELKEGWGCVQVLCLKSFLPDWGTDVTQGWAPLRGSHRSVTQPGRQLSDGLSSRLISLACLLFMCQCCVTKHSTWTYPKSPYVEKTAE